MTAATTKLANLFLVEAMFLEGRIRIVIGDSGVGGLLKRHNWAASRTPHRLPVDYYPCPSSTSEIGLGTARTTPPWTTIDRVLRFMPVIYGVVEATLLCHRTIQLQIAIHILG